MATLEFEWDSRDLAVWRGRKVDKALFRALSKAGNDALRGMRIESTRSVRQSKRLKIAKIRSSLPLDYPQAKDINGLVWRMRVSGKPIPAAEYPHRQTRKGVSIAINSRKEGRSFIRSAFISTMRSGHKGIFVRRGKGRLPIQEVYSSKVSDVFNDDGMIGAVQTHASGVFSKAFKRLLPLELAKIKR